MKKSIFSFVAILLLIFLSIAANSQNPDLSAAQKEERCKNNLKRIEALESERRKLDADLSVALSDQKIAESREQMVFVKTFRNRWKNGVRIPLADYDLLESYSKEYDFNFTECQNKKGILYCTTQFEKIINRKIDAARAMKPQRAGMEAKKKNIEMQIQNHQTNLVALGCANFQGDCLVPVIQGKFKTDGDPTGILVFTQSGSHVSGKYGPTESKLENSLEGEFKCNVLTGSFTNNAYKITGKFEYTFSSDGKSYSGRWRNDSDGRTGQAGGGKLD